MGRSGYILMKHIKKEYLDESEFPESETIEKGKKRVSLNDFHKFFDEIEHYPIDTEKLIKSIIKRITPRQREVFDLMLRGFNNEIIALSLGISERKVRFHRLRIEETFDKIYPNKRSLPRSKKAVPVVLVDGALGTRIKPTNEDSKVPPLLPHKKQ